MSERSRLLLHVCCGPCATVALERLLPQYEVTAYWYNPNIAPPEEHDLRLEAARVVAAHAGVELVEAGYDPESWEECVSGLEDAPEGGARCEFCFAHRLANAAQYAQANRFTRLACTLTVGPRKNALLINTLGSALATAQGLRFVEADFRKQGGFLRSVELSRELGIYRQTYCGCAYSRRK
jgi:epoxyqueuosine reductase